MLKPSERKLQKLDRFLSRLDHGDDVMLLSELDGFIAGLVVCPELIRPGEWLGAVWGEDGPVFQSEREANEILDLVMAHYNDVIRKLDNPGRYAPLFEEERDGSVMWDMWMIGFGKAIALRPDAWTAFSLADDPDVRRAMAAFRKLHELVTRPGGEFNEIDDALDASAPDLIPDCLKTLHAARLALQGSISSQTTAIRPVGRNDPCPCGSGKKFKKCCLN